HVGVRRLQHAAFLALLDENAQLLRRVDGLFQRLGALPEDPQHEYRRGIEPDREWPHDRLENSQRRREDPREALGVCERNASRCQFPKHDVQIRYNRDRHRGRNTTRASLSPARAIASSRVRRDRTNANSAATKKAFSASSTTMAIRRVSTACKLP